MTTRCSSRRQHLCFARAGCVLTLLTGCALAAAQSTPADPQAAWLGYQPVRSELVFPAGAARPDTVVLPGGSAVLDSAAREIVLGWRGMMSRSLRTAPLAQASLAGNAIVLGTVQQLQVLGITPHGVARQAGSFALQSMPYKGHRLLVIAGHDEDGVLYGAFALLRIVAQQHSLTALHDAEAPAAPVRWTNEWDNLDGSIERGYAGRSIFFEKDAVRTDLDRARAYGRLLASVGINGCTINNVNADARLLQPEKLEQIARIADAFRPYGVRLSLSIDMSSPQKLGGLKTFDPLDPDVIAWWQKKIDAVYALIPDFGGVVIKADSEGQAGPSQYGRTPADAANVLARALKPHGGVVLYRGFVYNHHLEWQDPKADRARAGYDNFHSLDGRFDENVIVQIKHGPIDFQVREPVSPLFASLQHTNEAVELQITQEYTGQQRHLVFLAPMWKQALDTEMQVASGEPSRLRDIVTGRTFHRAMGGFVGVANVGLDDTWLGHPLAAANLYGFGRLAWNPTLTSAQIAEEWTRLTFGNDPQIDRVIAKLELDSWRNYEDYTGPLGVGTLTDIIGVHYGPGIESAERNGWGQWIRADHTGIGMDRTVATGTGYIGQYPAGLAAQYESLATCPDDLLLFLHHVPYGYRLHSGSTVIQHVYDTHYAGAAAAAAQVSAWESLAGKVPDRTYFEVLRRFQYQAGHAIVWRDAVNDWFYKMSGIADIKNRVGNHPGRIEAESMHLDGYTATEVTPWETASGGKAILCKEKRCTAALQFAQPDGLYDVAVQYFDLNNGASHFHLLLNGASVAEWTADDSLPSSRLDGHTSTRYTVCAIAMHTDDTLSIAGEPDAQEPAPLDYIEITPSAQNSARKELP